MGNERLTLEIIAQASGQETVDRLTSAMNRLATTSEAASARSTQAFQRTGSAAEHAVPQIAAASAAIRALEGNLSVRAVERFATDVLGLGSALQKIFPLVGGLALGEVFIKGGEELYKFYQKWDPVHQAQQRAVDLAKELDVEIHKLGEELQNLRFDNLEKAIGKSANAFRAQSSQTDIQGTRNLIAAENLNVEAFKKRINNGMPAGSTQLAGGTSYSFATGTESQDVKAARIDLASSEKRLHDLNIQLQVQQEKQSNLLMDMTQDQQDKNEDAAKDAEDKAKRAADKLAEQHKRALSIQESALQKSISDPLARAIRSTAYETLSFPGGGDRSIVAGASQSQLAGVAGEQMRKAAAETQRGYDQSLKGDERYFLETLRLNTSELERKYEATKKVLEVDKQLGEAEDAITRQTGANQVRRVTDGAAFNSRMIDLAPGLSEGQRGGLQIANELSAAERRYQIERDIAAQLNDEKRQSEAFNEAELNHELALQKVREDGMVRAAQMQAERVRSFRSEVGSIFDAATSGHPAELGNLLRSQALGIGRTVTENAAQKYVLPMIQNAIPHASGTLGTLLQGTPFGPDPLKGATDQNTLATQANTEALRAISGFGSSAGGTNPGGSGGLVFGGSKANPFVFSGFGSDGSGLEDSNWDIYSQAGIDPGYKGTQQSTFKSGNLLGKSLAVAGAAGGAYAAFSDFRSGGAKNDIAGVGSALGSGAAIASLFGPAGAPVALGLGIASMVTSFVSALFPDPHQVRDKAITKELEQARYNAPMSMSISESTSGRYADLDYRGNARVSNLSPYPTLMQPYTFWSGQTPYSVPGSTVTPYSGAATGSGQAPVSNVTVNLHALDLQSMRDGLVRNHSAVGEALVAHLFSGDTATHGALKFHAGN